MDPKNKVFEEVEAVIKRIRERIIFTSDMNEITAKELSDDTRISERDVEVALHLMTDLGRFMGSASGMSGKIGYSQVSFPLEKTYDAYLAFDNLEDLMEEFYVSHAPSSQNSMSYRDQLISITGGVKGTEGYDKKRNRGNLLPADMPPPERSKFFPDKFCHLFDELQRSLQYPDHQIAISISFRSFLEVLTNAYLEKNALEVTGSLAIRMNHAFRHMSARYKMSEEARAFIHKLSDDSEYFSINSLHKVTHHNFQMSENDLRCYANNLDSYIRHGILDVNYSLEGEGRKLS